MDPTADEPPTGVKPRDDNFASLRRYTLGDLLREHRRSRPNMVASVDGFERLNYRELDCRVNRVADALRARGVGAGDRIMWVGQNSARIMELLLACAKIGAVICPANWRVTPNEFLLLVRDFDPKIVFWQSLDVGHVYHVNSGEWLGHDRHWIQHDGEGSASYVDFLASGRDIDNEADVDPELPVLAVYTAGFDGQVKAAMLSHTAILLQSMISARGQAIDETSIYLMSGPMFHIGVLMGGFATLVHGGRCVYVRRVEPFELLDLVEGERITHAYLPGQTVEKMLQADAAGERDLTSLFSTRELKHWTPPLAIPQHAPMRHHIGQYGQTELMGSVVLSWLGGTGAGRPAAFVQARLLDDEGQEVPDGEVGEIAARGPLLMCGYLGAAAENAARTATPGWYRTRDLGRRNPDGSISFVGPKARLIKTGLENVYPAEVEACLRLHPGVADVCVLGVPDPQWAQNVKAVVVLRADAATTAEDLVEHCRNHIASYKKPKILAFCDYLPRLPTGALDRDGADEMWGGGGYPSAR